MTLSSIEAFCLLVRDDPDQRAGMERYQKGWTSPESKDVAYAMTSLFWKTTVPWMLQGGSYPLCLFMISFFSLFFRGIFASIRSKCQEICQRNGSRASRQGYEAKTGRSRSPGRSKENAACSESQSGKRLAGKKVSCGPVGRSFTDPKD